jgi:hypothetical protein
MKTLRFVVPLVAALSMATTLAHLLEMPARLAWDAPLWIATTVTGGLFRMFGSVGAMFEVGAVVLAAVLAWQLRGLGRAFGLALAGAVLLVAAHLLFWLLVAPVNAEIATWTPGVFPADWASWRAQWEYSHALRALLQIAGFAALLGSALAELRRAPDPVRHAPAAATWSSRAAR